MNIKFLALSLLFFISLNCQERKSMLLVDTFANKSYSYNIFITLAESVGFKVEHVNFYNLKHKNIDNFDALLLVASPAFIANMDRNLIAAETIEMINCFVYKKNKLVGLIVPHVTSEDDAYSVKELIKYMSMLSYKSRDIYRDMINWLLLYKIYKKLSYKTTLPPAKEYTPTPKDINNLSFTTEKDGLLFSAILPLNCDLKKYFPTGLYAKNSIYNNHFFLSKIPMLFFTEISEEFRINPIDKNIKIEMLQALQQTLLELRTLLNTQDINTLKSLEPATLPQDLTQAINQESTSNNKINCGWIATEAFEDDKVQKTVNNIANANLNLLWINFKPERYFSKNATGADKEQFLKSIHNFTLALKEKYKELNKALPKIFIGIEITHNLKTAPVANAMVDIYETTYTKIPAPLDFDNLWAPEVLDSFDAFYNAWKNGVGNGINIDGVFLDFEMYHAQDQESSYPSVADFSDTSWQVYESVTTVPNITNAKKRIKYLYKNNKFDDYFKVLEVAAARLGKQLRECFKKYYPDISIAAYMPTLPNSWFYTGILSGLSTQTEPIILATFNNEFLMHNKYLLNHNIYALHMPVILLSQFKDASDFCDINYFKKYHDGVWFNRFSWLSFPYQSDKWWSIEATPLDPDIVTKEIGSKF